MLDQLSNSENNLTRKESSTLALLRSGYYVPMSSYKSRIKKNANFNVCADCGMTPHYVKQLFVFPPNYNDTVRFMEHTAAVRELSYLEASDLLRTIYVMHLVCTQKELSTRCHAMNVKLYLKTVFHARPVHIYY